MMGAFSLANRRTLHILLSIGERAYRKEKATRCTNMETPATAAAVAEAVTTKRMAMRLPDLHVRQSARTAVRSRRDAQAVAQGIRCIKTVAQAVAAQVSVVADVASVVW